MLWFIAGAAAGILATLAVEAVLAAHKIYRTWHSESGYWG